MEKSRGVFLSVLIVFMAAAITLATLALALVPGVQSVLGTFPAWFNAFLVVFLLARLIGLAAIWSFSRWGVYLFVVLESGEGALGLFVFKSVFPFALRLTLVPLTLLALFVLFYLALRSRWHAFT